MSDEPQGPVPKGPVPMSFEHALVELKRGHKLQRTGWNGPDQWVKMQRPDVESMTPRYIYIKTQQGALVPWVVSHGDLFANDWRIVT